MTLLLIFYQKTTSYNLGDNNKSLIQRYFTSERPTPPLHNTLKNKV